METIILGPVARVQQALREPGEGEAVGRGVPRPGGKLREGGEGDPGHGHPGRPGARGAQDDVRCWCGGQT